MPTCVFIWTAVLKFPAGHWYSYRDFLARTYIYICICSAERAHASYIFNTAAAVRVCVYLYTRTDVCVVRVKIKTYANIACAIVNVCEINVCENTLACAK